MEQSLILWIINLRPPNSNFVIIVLSLKVNFLWFFKKNLRWVSRISFLIYQKELSIKGQASFAKLPSPGCSLWIWSFWRWRKSPRPTSPWTKSQTASRWAVDGSSPDRSAPASNLSAPYADTTRSLALDSSTLSCPSPACPLHASSSACSPPFHCHPPQSGYRSVSFCRLAPHCTLSLFYSICPDFDRAPDCCPRSQDQTRHQCPRRPDPRPAHRPPRLPPPHTPTRFSNLATKREL